MSFIILNNPILATIQDRGRYNHTDLGITPSGVCDMYAYRMANKLLNNPYDTNTLEIFYGNITLQATKETTISITGATCDVFLNQKKISLWQTIHINPKDTIRIGNVSNGMIVYLSVKNGFLTHKTLESYATTIKEKLGGLDGNKLQKNTILPFNTYKLPIIKRIQKKFIPNYPDELALRVILSYQHKSFDKKEKETFFNNTYTITNKINRMGYKLQGKAIKSKLNGIISEGIAYGSIQIPHDGQPIILLKERQTIGGYPKIGVVLEKDCYKLSQAKPNSKIRFQKISMEEGIKIQKKFLSSSLS